MAASPDFFASVQFRDLTLRVADLARAQAFYQDVLGMVCRPSPPGTVALGSSGGDTTLVVLQAAPDAPPRPRGTAGLFHVAFLYPERAALARALRHLMELGLPVGSADHGVSEAIYLSDSEGNGIELYADRPIEAWPRSTPSGPVTMYTEALDLSDLLAHARQAGPLLPAATRIGHVHLSVANLDHAEQFYGGHLGLAVTERGYPGALFLGRDGYHHHVGANIWRSGNPAVPGTLGLARFTVAFTRPDDLAAAAKSLGGVGLTRGSDGRHLDARDADGIEVRLALAG